MSAVRRLSSVPLRLSEADADFCLAVMGDLDRLLPSSYGEGDLHFELRNMSVGTRLHVGEGMLTECWTWRGEMTVSLGTDDLVFDLAQAQEILDEVKLLVHGVTATQSQL